MSSLLGGLLKNTALTKNRAPGAEGLLWNEPLGLAIDATTEGGTVYVRDTAAANNRYNEPLNGWFGSAGLLTNSGTSPKLCQWNDGTLHWSAHNIALQSQTLDNAAWTKTDITTTANDTAAPDGSVTADKLVQGSAGTAKLISASGISTSVAIYTISAYIKISSGQWLLINPSDNGGNGVQAWFDLSGIAAGSHANTGSGWAWISSTITDVGNSWYRCSVTYSGQTSHFPTFLITSADNVTTRQTAGAWWQWGTQVNKGMTATAYLATTAAAVYGIPQQYDVTTNQFGILSEPAATNIYLRSETVGSMTQNRVTTTADATTAPDGATTADKVVETATTGAHCAHTAFTGTAAVYTGSVYVKAAERTRIALRLYNGTSYITEVYFNVSTGTIINTVSGSGTITAVGNGWYRCTVTGTLAASAACEMEPTLMLDDTTISYLGDITQGIYLWGYQMELGSVATTYVPTIAASVTRAADAIKTLTSGFPWSDTNGTVYIDYKPFRVDTGSRYAWSAYKASTDFISLLDSTADPIMGNTQASSADVATDLGTLVANTRTQITTVAKGNDFSGSQDGLSVSVDTGATLTTGYTNLYVGTTGATGSELNGLVYRLAYAPSRVGDANLPSWRFRL